MTDKPDPKRLLEMALEGLEPSKAPKTPPPAIAELEDAFPQFDILGLIGQGGMGSVFRVRQRRLDRLVALKVMARELAEDPTFEERFLREAKALARLEHPNLLTVHDFGESGGFCYLVTELVDGSDLRQLLDMGRISPREMLRLVPQICDALQYAHDNGVVHRDIKPENILIDQDGRVKLADFGLAKLADPSADVTLTRSRQGLGTPHYMAPEQFTEARDVDHRADIYALGVVIYEMLTGQLPIGRFEPPSRMAEVSEGVDDVVLRALATAVEQRYQSARELKTAVEGAELRRAVAKPKPRSRARLCKLPILAVALLCVMSVVVWVGFMVSLDSEAARMQYQAAVGRYNTMLAQKVEWERQHPGEDYPFKVVRPRQPVSKPTSRVPPYVLGILVLVTAVVVTVLGHVAVARIRCSGGALYGLGLAVFVAWLLPLAIVNGVVATPLSEIRDRDVFGVAVPLVILLLAGADVVFLRWQYRRAISR